jgi:undecaprenyl-diphosphatase
MSLFLIAVLALVQGVTEFLPISSSAHLVLTRWLWLSPSTDAAAGLALDVALHVGTLAAVMLYFRGDVAVLFRGTLRLLKGHQDGDARLAWLILLATLPAVIMGFTFKTVIETSLRGVEVIAWTTLIFGILLWIADRTSTNKKISDLDWKKALLVGVAQAFALVPGVSRSGVTITVGRWLGMGREEAARFALILSLPTITGAAVLSALKLDTQIALDLLQSAVVGAFIAFIAAYIAISLMMAWLRKATFMPFVFYRIALGVGLLIAVYY